MFIKEDTTYNDIRKKSLNNWLDEMESHDDVSVRGGVRLTREYVSHLENEIDRLHRELELKNSYLKKMKMERS